MNDDLLNDKLNRHEKKIEEFDNRLDKLEQQRIKILIHGHYIYIYYRTIYKYFY